MTVKDPEDSAVAALFARVAPRTRPPADVRESVYRSTLSVWEQEVSRRRRRRWLVALAAGVAVAVIGAGVMLRLPGTVLPDALTAKDVNALPDGVRAESVGLDGRRQAAPGGETLRLKAGSRFAMQGERLWLLAGAVYVESRGSPGGEQLVVIAGGATVRHTGTRYAVSLESGSVEVRVRDGQVEVVTAAARERASGGTSLAVSPDGRRLARTSIPMWGPAWTWVEQLAPPQVIDGQVLSRVLEGIAYEAGRRLEFESEAVRKVCEATHLKGPVLELPASGRLLAVLVTTDLEAVEDGERIVIRQKAR